MYKLITTYQSSESNDRRVESVLETDLLLVRIWQHSVSCDLICQRMLPVTTFSLIDPPIGWVIYQLSDSSIYGPSGLFYIEEAAFSFLGLLQGYKWIIFPCKVKRNQCFILKLTFSLTYRYFFVSNKNVEIVIFHFTG